MEDQYGKIEIPTVGVEKRNTDALECLLAMCRVLGLRYEITQGPSGRYHVKVSWQDWPTDYMAPYERNGSYSILGETDPVQGLRVTIIGAINSLVRNGEHFRRGFREYWLMDTGHPWGKDDR